MQVYEQIGQTEEGTWPEAQTGWRPINYRRAYANEV